MRVVDTSAWIEWLLDTATGKSITPHLPAGDEWVVPTMVQFELVKWAQREAAVQSPAGILAFSSRLNVIELTTEIAVSAASLSASHRLASADAIIYATAILHEADVLTCDGHFEGLPGVLYLPKKQN